LNLSAIIIFKVVGWGQWDIFWGDGLGWDHCPHGAEGMSHSNSSIDFMILIMILPELFGHHVGW